MILQFFLSLLVAGFFSLITSDQPKWVSDQQIYQVLTSDGTELHVTVRGEGIPCLYIHGGPGVGSYWMEQLYGNVLEKHFQMIYLDQRGSGRSGSAHSGDYSIERMALDFEEVRQYLAINSWITFSHSFGGIMQVKHAELYPETVRGMLMVAPTLSLNESIQEMIPYALDMLEIPVAEHEQYLDEKTYPFDRLMPLFHIARERGLFWKFHYGEASNYDIMDSVMNQITNHNFDFSNRAFALSQYYENYKPLATRLSMPVLLFYGKKDYAIGPNHHNDIKFSNMTKVGWDGGHVPFMEGRDELGTAITDWLTTIK